MKKLSDGPNASDVKVSCSTEKLSKAQIEKKMAGNTKSKTLFFIWGDREGGERKSEGKRNKEIDWGTRGEKVNE